MHRTSPFYKLTEGPKAVLQLMGITTPEGSISGSKEAAEEKSASNVGHESVGRHPAVSVSNQPAQQSTQSRGFR